MDKERDKTLTVGEFVKEYNELVKKYNLAVVPVMKLELQSLQKPEPKPEIIKK